MRIVALTERDYVCGRLPTELWRSRLQSGGIEGRRRLINRHTKK
jgi:hypothetical protein